MNETSDLAVRAERAEEALWNLTVAVGEVLDPIDRALLGWEPVTLPGLPPVSLAFLLEHLSAELERLCGRAR